MSIDTMTPRQLVVGLMRGNSENFQQGYNVGAAVIAVQRLRPELSTAELSRLRAYAEGWQDGVQEDIPSLSPVLRDSDAKVAV